MWSVLQCIITYQFWEKKELFSYYLFLVILLSSILPLLGYSSLPIPTFRILSSFFKSPFLVLLVYWFFTSSSLVHPRQCNWNYHLYILSFLSNFVCLTTLHHKYDSAFDSISSTSWNVYYSTSSSHSDTTSVLRICLLMIVFSMISTQSSPFSFFNSSPILQMPLSKYFVCLNIIFRLWDAFMVHVNIGYWRMTIIQYSICIPQWDWCQNFNHCGLASNDISQLYSTPKSQRKRLLYSMKLEFITRQISNWV